MQRAAHVFGLLVALAIALALCCLCSHMLDAALRLMAPLIVSGCAIAIVRAVTPRTRPE